MFLNVQQRLSSLAVTWISPWVFDVPCRPQDHTPQLDVTQGLLHLRQRPASINTPRALHIRPCTEHQRIDAFGLWCWRRRHWGPSSPLSLGPILPCHWGPVLPAVTGAPSSRHWGPVLPVIGALPPPSLEARPPHHWGPVLPAVTGGPSSCHWGLSSPSLGPIFTITGAHPPRHGGLSSLPDGPHPAVPARA